MIESRWGAKFSAPTQTDTEAQPATCTMGTGSFPGVKRPGRGADHPPHLAPRLKKGRTVTLLPLWVFVACSRVNFNCIHIYIYTYRGTAVAQWLRCCGTNRKVAGLIPAGVIGIFY